jgi:gamma-glutamylcyclotransferase (GGCT)/AIG2-like uncharacterized protein YtfP
VPPEASAGSTFRLFVYGTLKRGGCRHGPLAAQRFLGEARTRPAYALLDLGAYPGLVPCPGGGQAVAGELYEVDDALRPWLDGQEGAPDLFRLEPVDLEGEAGPAQAYFYQLGPAGLPHCPSGRWDGRRPAREGARP